MTPEERLWCLDGDAPTWAGLTFLDQDGYHRAPFTAGRIDRLGVPGFAFSDGPRGVVIGNGCCFPVPMARGATWDPQLEEAIGDAIGLELKASGATLTGAVCVNLLRHPAWGRAQETYGEDPHHVGVMGAALTRGLQRHVMACVKHFACNSIEDARFMVDVEVDEIALHEVYLPHFKHIVEEGVAAVMSAYNSVNGEWCGQNRFLLTDVLRGEWGFSGFVISDWIFGLRDAAKSLMAGLDVEMPYRMVRAQHLPTALDEGEASWDHVDAAATRLVATLLRFAEVLASPRPDRSAIDSSNHRGLARLAAARSVVLLRNEPVDATPVLPLDPSKLSSLAVFGHLAAHVNLGDAGSSDVWALGCRTVLDGLLEVIGPDRVVHHSGDDLTGVAATAAEADVAVVVVGNTYLDEGEFIGETPQELLSLFPGEDDPELVERYEAEIAAFPQPVKPPHVARRPASASFATGGDRRSLRLAPTDIDLIHTVAAANRRTVVVLQGGSALIVDEWEYEVAAILHAWYGGCEAGPGLCDVLFGQVDPSGRLPLSVPREETQLPVFDTHAERVTYDRWHGWRRFRRTGQTPAFPYGFGLSYTSFELGPAEVARVGDELQIEGTLTNTGRRDGADVVQVYAELPDHSRPPRLIGFTRVEVAAGAQENLSLRIPLERLATRDPVRHCQRAPEGTHRVSIARHAEDSRAQVVMVEL